MMIFKRELKINFKTYILWTLLLMFIFLIVFLIFPSISSSENIVLMEKMLESYPEELLKTFNMDISAVDSVYGWLKSEGITSLLLVCGLFSSVLGANLLLKEESNHTIAFLHSKPVTRNGIVTSKILAGIFYIFLMVLSIFIFNCIGLLCSHSLYFKEYFLLTISQLFSFLPIFFISMFISCYFRRSKGIIGISIGIVFISYFLMVLSTLNEKVKFLQYFSLFTLTNTRKILLTHCISFESILISVVISLLFAALIYFKYSRKDFIS